VLAAAQINIVVNAIAVCHAEIMILLDICGTPKHIGTLK
jgi:hypothetical protein